MKSKIAFSVSLTAALSMICFTGVAWAQSWRPQVAIDWKDTVRISKTIPTYQIVASALLRRESPIHDRVFQDLRDLDAEDVRFQAWYPLPRLAVAELKPPHDGHTFWDFSMMDPIVIDFLNATKGHKVVLNLATIPEWMFKTAKPVPYPSDPNVLDYNYDQGTVLRDPTMREVADYFARLANWYTQGGFTDEYGHWHASGHHFDIAYWEVLNEVDLEHHMSPETYTALYDAVVQAVRSVDPRIKFVGLAIAGTSMFPFEQQNPRYFEYFLNPKNHRPGIPIDMISYHFYATPGADESPYIQQFTVFGQADRFLSLVKYIDLIRHRLSPRTGTDIDEIGIISADDQALREPGHISKPIPTSYWNLSAAMYAYLYLELSRMGIDVAGMSSGLGYPNDAYPSVTMINWKKGQPTARYWALKLLIENCGPGDRLVETTISEPFVAAQAYVTPQGKRRILLVNKRSRPFQVVVPGIKGGVESYVDETTNFHPPASRILDDNQVVLQGYAVSVITFAGQ